MAVLLFPDQLANGHRQLLRIQRTVSNTIYVSAFLEKAHSALREEIGLLPQVTRAQIPAFNNVVNLSERLQTQKIKRLEVASALHVVYQLTIYLQTIENHPELAPSKDDLVAGYGLGQLSAAAVAAAPSTIEFVDIAVEAVRIAFRIAGAVARLNWGLEQPEQASTQGWSLDILGSPEAVQQALNTLQDGSDIPQSARIYISSVGSDTCTISGQPSRLSQFTSNAELSRSARVPDVSTIGLWNAPHIYTKDHIAEILSDRTTYLSTLPLPHRPLISSATGKAIAAGSAQTLFENVAHDILRQSIRLDLIHQGLSKSSRVISFANNGAKTEILATALKGNKVEVQDIASLENYTGKKADPAKETAGIHKIAIVGFSGRFPGAPDIEGLWDVLTNGRDMHKRIPKDRWDVETHYDRSGKTNNTSHTPYGCFIEEPGLFDPRFFNMSPREATQTDPMHRLALVTAYEALEMSGFALNSTPSTQASRVGTFYGQTSDDWREVNAAQNIETYFISGGVRAFAPGRINYHFGFSGPSYSVDTACSSSLAAIQVACTSLRAGECDTAVTGGVNVLTAPDIYAGLSRGQFVSKTGGCKTWDTSADGYCRADAVGSVILKRLEDAVAEKDKIYGVILATATNHSADAISITHPHTGNQIDLYQSVLHLAGVDPLEVSYVELHGTGTQAGDLAETRSVTEVFAPRGLRNTEQKLHIGAVKSNIGHSEAAAGVSALVKVLLMLQKNAIPPHIGVKTTINPVLPNFNDLNVQVPFKQTPWLRSAEKRRVAFINNFSAAGGNTAMLLEEGPLAEISSNPDPRPTLPFVISAKSLSSLKKNITKIIEWAKSNPDASLGSLSYSLTARRMHHTYRVGVTASDLPGLIKALQARVDTTGMSPVPSKAPKTAFIFTGQGGFYKGLGRKVYELSAEFRADINHFDRVSVNHGFPSILPAIIGDDSELSPLTTQLVMVSVQIALVRQWQSWGIQPSVVIGHSLGEYAALYAAGVLSAEDTIYLVARRAQLLETKITPNTHAMIAVKAGLEEISSSLSGASFEVACLNSPKETVLSSDVKNVQKIEKSLKASGYRFKVLDLPYAYHSAQLEPILADFENVVSSAVVFNKPRVPVISPLLSQVVETEGVFNAKYLARHARESVNFVDAVQEAVSGGFLDEKTILLEVGPHPICSTMVKATYTTNAPSVASLERTEDPWKTLSSGLSALHSAGLPVDWRHFHHEYDASHELLPLPGYSFDNKNYWIDYVNDWCLHKAEPRTTNVVVEKVQQLPPPTLSKLSTSVHGITSEEFGTNTGKVVSVSRFSDPTLRAVVLGHLVNDAGLCPSSLYADIAFTLTNYVLGKLRPGSTDIGVNCGNMEVVKPLIVRGNESNQILQVSVDVDLDQSQGTLRYSSINEDGKELEHHATCSVTFEDKSSWMPDWAPNTYWVKDRIAMLKDKVNSNVADQVSRKLAYKLFGSLVNYQPAFQGMEEVIFDSNSTEGTARVAFQTQEKDGSFDVNPYWIDSVAHLSGFILNGGGTTDSKNYVYVSHGWKSMRLAQPLQRSTVYQSYVKMQPAPNNVMVGDVYIMDAGEIVGVFGGLKFQRIPRKTLNTFLPPNGLSAARPVVAAKPTPAPAPVRSKPAAPQPVIQQKPKAIAAPPTPAAPAGPAVSASKIVDQAMQIIAEESDLAPSELQDDCELSNLGIDSLLSLQISGKIREVMELDIGSSAFLDAVTLGDFKEYLLKFLGSSASASASQSASESVIESVSASSASSSVSSKSESWEEISQSSFESNEIPDVKPTGSKEKLGLRTLIRTTIAEEMGVPLEEVASSHDLASLGLDSLMGICILGALREKTELEFPSSLFVDYNSMEAVEEFLGLTESSPSVKSSSASRPKAAPIHTPGTPKAKAVSLLLQGKPSTADKTLFLFPDGSGSPTSYASIPPIDRNIAVYGLQSPFMTHPSDFDNGIEGISTLYLEEVRRRQPKGPYYLGGWSAGGIVAYEVTQQLLRDGESVEQLILFDSPCPIKLEALPKRLHTFFAEIGLLGSNGQEPPAWLLPHFDSSIKALSAYNPKPITDPSKIPKTLAIWARHGVCRNPGDPRPTPTDDEPKSMKWLLDNRTDFGSNGWDALLGQKAMTMKTIDGNHFTIMKDGEQLYDMAAYMKAFLASK